jgi:hypothetical protein
MSDAYRTITVRLRSVQRNVIVVDKPKTRDAGTCTIPRSLLHGFDDLKLSDMPQGSIDVPAFPMRLREWKAEELGFAE